jgi:hypothetical protein
MQAGAGAFTPVPLPDPQVPGFSFPESESTVLSWVHDPQAQTPGSAAFNNIRVHGWGLWTALTMPTSQIDNGERLRVFETWYTPQEISLQPVPLTKTSVASPALSARVAHSRAPLRRFVQFEHGLNPRDRSLMEETQGSDTVFGYVKFDPTSAAHVVSEQLLSTSALNQLLMGGAQQIPVFPSTSLTLKSAFQVITQKTLVDGRYYRLNVWTGPPSTPQAYGPIFWPGVVWVDTLGRGTGSGQVDMEASTDGGTRTSATTYPITMFINHRLTATEAAQFNAASPGAGAQSGDYAILVAMHVAGREIARWTWQTFWWTPTPDDPQLPSSQAAAALRPQQLTGPARNYAMALAYDMADPGQPNTGGQNAGSALYAYNPYLEARFGPDNLPDSVAGNGPDGQPASNNTGVQCNCMSCHVRANYNPNNLATAPQYSAARYTDMNDPQFAGTLQVDLLWSLPELAQ